MNNLLFTLGIICLCLASYFIGRSSLDLVVYRIESVSEINPRRTGIEIYRKCGSDSGIRVQTVAFPYLIICE